MSDAKVNSVISGAIINETISSKEHIIPDDISRFDTLTKPFYSNTRNQENIGTLLSGPANQLPVNELSDHLKNVSENKKPVNYTGEPTTSINRYFLVDFENDVFTNTDYYFTNGMQISVIAPVFQFFGLNRALPGLGKNTLNYYGIGIRQNMYTGINPEMTEITLNDRPFSGVLYLEFFKFSYDTDRKLKLSSSIRTGVLGSYSLASSLQSGLHDLYPIGWKYQIENDIILNFQGQIEKGIISNRYFEINASVQSSIGTLNTDLGGAFKLRFGRLDNYFNGFYTAKPGTLEYSKVKKMKYWVSAEFNQQFIIYNATLNGGLFQKNSPYILSFNELNHNLTRINIGINCFYKQNGVVLGFTQISPEIKGGRSHRWGSIRLIHNF
jgi:lipid A 3-O-deacylase